MTELPPRSQRNPQRGELLLNLPGRPVVVDMCVKHPRASSAVAAAAAGTGVSAEAKDTLKRDKYGRTGTVTCRFDPLFHKMHGRAGPPVFALLHELAELAASTEAISKNIFMENAMRGHSMTICRGIAQQVLPSAPSRAHLNGRRMVASAPVWR